MTGSTTVISWNLPQGSNTVSATYWGSVISVNPTATAIALACSPDCQSYQATFGPWAQVTPPPSASTGSYDQINSYPLVVEEMDVTNTNVVSTSWTETGSSGQPLTQTQSVHCDMTSTTVAAVCTISGYGAGPEWQFNVTRTNLPSSLWGNSLTPVTITAGIEKLDGSSSSTAASGKTSTSSGGSTKPTASSTTAASSGSASSIYTVNTGMLALLGVLAAFVLH